MAYTPDPVFWEFKATMTPGITAVVICPPDEMPAIESYITRFMAAAAIASTFRIEPTFAYTEQSQEALPEEEPSLTNPGPSRPTNTR